MSLIDAPDMPPTKTSPRIGVFDSGVGGLSVLRSLQRLMPSAALTYVADSAHAPYGERDDAFVVERSGRIARWLVERQGAELLVVACNTATAAAVKSLRETWQGLPIVGVEPGVKPAVAASRRKSVGVLATPSTLRSSKFNQLLDQYRQDAQVHLVPCAGLAAEIEKGDVDTPAIADMIQSLCRPLVEAGIDVAVLGCTHYAFVRHHIERSLGPSVAIIDTADAVARRAAALASALDSRLAATLAPVAATGPRLYTTGDPHLLANVAMHWLNFRGPAEAALV